MQAFVLDLLKTLETTAIIVAAFRMARAAVAFDAPGKDVGAIKR